MFQVVLNIPKEFGSCDLRNYFSQFIEKELFECFHYRHRPILHFPEWATSIVDVSQGNVNLSRESTSQSKNFYEEDSQLNSTSCCCPMKTKAEYNSMFFKLYNNKHWVDSNGIPLKSKCFIKNLEESSMPNDVSNEFRLRKEFLADQKKFNLINIQKNFEFKPPPEMPFGNVGTPTEHFKILIRSCKLAPSIISRLGIDVNRKKKKKRYSQVPLNYGTQHELSNKSEELIDEEGIAFTAKGDLIPSSFEFKSVRPKVSLLPASLPRLETIQGEDEDDDADAEEWDRYEAFHEDVTKQGRAKERLYESEIELVWEKGGPGLVFYTDAQYWKEKEGDFDEQTTDEWDVDMSGYYGNESVDLDAHASLSMHRMTKLKEGKFDPSVFKQKDPHCENQKFLKKRGPEKKTCKIGNFEKHTKGIGRRLLESQGWKEGEGLGKTKDGMAFALGNDGQHPGDKKGFGFHVQAANTARLKSKEAPHLISTIYDKPEDVDPQPSIFRSSQATSLTHRINAYPLLFTRSSSSL